MKNFLYYYNEFDKKYRDKLSFRWPTMKAALNLFLQRKGVLIVETGCARLKDDYGAGYSSVVFGDFCKKYGTRLFTVDISAQNIETCKTLTEEYKYNIDYFIQDSVGFLTDLNNKVDLLYLDSFDYPFLELRDIKGIELMTEAEIVEKYNHIIAPCQIHCYNELQAALPFIHNKTVILIDDNDFPGGGKPRLAKEWLINNSWECILESQQTLWIKK